MKREEYIEFSKQETFKYIAKAKLTKLKFLKYYYMGKAYITAEVVRRLTGEKIDIAKGYFVN